MGRISVSLCRIYDVICNCIIYRAIQGYIGKWKVYCSIIKGKCILLCYLLHGAESFLRG